MLVHKTSLYKNQTSQVSLDSILIHSYPTAFKRDLKSGPVV